jgi:alpha-galactosidase
MAAPLIAGHDARTMTKETAEILLNSEIIDVDQDPWGIQGRRIKQNGKAETWVKPIAKKGARAVALFNASFDYPELYWEGKEETISVKWEELGLKPGKAKLRDLWAHEDMGEFIDGYETLVQPESVKMLIIEGTEFEPGSGETELSALKPMYYAVAAGEMSADKACSTASANPGKIKINGKTFEKGTSVCGATIALYNLGKKCSSFEAQIGVDDSAGTKGTVVFEVWTDNKKAYSSGIVKAGDDAKKIAVDLTGKQTMKLVVNNAGDTTEGDAADWAEAKTICK